MDIYTGFDYNDEEIALLKEHDAKEELHAFYSPEDSDVDYECGECGDTPEGLMHNNTWRDIEPLLTAATPYRGAIDYTDAGGNDIGWQDSTFPNEY